MKLKDFVFNSLRGRGRRKKPAPRDASAEPDISTGCFGQDKKRNWFSSTGSRGRSRDSSFESNDLTEVKWQGNDLYEGLMATKVKEVKAVQMRSLHTQGHKIVSANAAGGFSSQPTVVSAGCTAVSDNLDLCPPRSLVTSVMDKQPYVSHQHYSQGHNRHNNHTSNYHFQGKDKAILVHNSQELKQKTNNVRHSSSHISQQNAAKQETSFFRKSINSFKSIRKHSSKTKNFYSKQSSNDQMTLYSHPETKIASTEEATTDKRHVRSKKTEQIFVSNFKENKEWQFSSANYENPWVLDNVSRKSSKGLKERFGHIASTPVQYERSYSRECSTESCPSTKYGFREDSSVRDLDFTGFESASLASCESDLSRGKFHRPRSRIKTNPWLPSPRTSLSMGSQRGECDLQESRENIMFMGDQDIWFRREASFERHRSVALPFQASPLSESESNIWRKSRHRSLPPSNIMLELNLTQSLSSPSCTKTRTVEKVTHGLASSPAVESKETVLNDLNMNAPKSRPTSITSPNSEFVKLADHLEQLANNISFEYEDILDSAMENVVNDRDNRLMFMQDSHFYEENGSFPKQKLKSDNGVHSSHSPDSGVGGISCSDVDLVLTPRSERETKCMSLEPFLSSKSLETVVSAFDMNPNECYRVALRGSSQEPQMDNTCSLPGRLSCPSLDIHNTFVLPNPSRQNTHTRASHPRRNWEANHALEQNDSSAVDQFDKDSASFQNCTATVLHELDMDNASFQNNTAAVLNVLDKVNASFQNNAATVLHELDMDNASMQNSTATVLHELDKGNASFQNNTATILHELVKGNASFQNNTAAVLHDLDKDNASFENKTVIANAADEGQGSEFCKENILTLKADADGNSTLKLMIEDVCDTQFQPCFRYFRRSDAVKRKDASVEDTSPVGSPARHTPDGISASRDGIACRTSSPALKVRPSILAGPKKMNNMEKHSVPEAKRRTWPEEFTIPRNITVNDCMESPTENWQWDGQFSVYSCQVNQNLVQMVSNDREQMAEGTLECGSTCIQLEELVVKLDDVASTVPPQNSKNESSSGKSWLTNCDLDKLENVSRDTSLDMSDACVQTDFDDDFDDMWEEVDLVEDLAEKDLHTSQSSRLRLTTRNLHVSLENLNSYLERNSWTMMDEDLLSFSEETEDRVLADSTSYEGSSSEIKQTKTQNFIYTEAASENVLYVDSFIPCLQTEAGLGRRLQDEDLKRSSPESRWQPLDMDLKQPSANKPTVVTALPESAVNMLFSDIEAQFREIFQQLCDSSDAHLTSIVPEYSSPLSLNPFSFESSLADIIPSTGQLREMMHPEIMDFETEYIKELLNIKSEKPGMDNTVYADNSNLNILSPNFLVNNMESNRQALQVGGTTVLGDRDSNGNFV